MNYDTWLQSDREFEWFHGLDEFYGDEEPEPEELADDEYDRRKDMELEDE